MLKLHDRRRALWALAAAVCVPLAPLGATASERWPDRPIRLVVPFPPGGTSDNVGRIVADALSAELGGAAVVVENKPGGTTQLGTESVARAAPDGYTLLVGAATGFTVLPHLRSKLPYDPVSSFTYLGGVAEYQAVLAVRKDLGVKTLQELIALAKKEPGKLTLGSAGLASYGHIAGAALQRETGIELLHVPFKGSADAVNALAGGQVDIVIDGAAVALAKAGRIQGLVSYGGQRHAELPDLPSLPETGVNVWTSKAPGWGLFGPAGLPAAVSSKLEAALKNGLARPALQERLRRTSTIPDWRTPQDLRTALDGDRKYYQVLLPSVGLKPD